MLDVGCLARLAPLLLCPEVRFVVCADFAQYKPVCNSWRGKVTDRTLEDSSLLWELARGHRLTLSTNRRSDQQLFDFCSILGYKSLKEELEEARRFFPTLPEGQDPDTSLVLSHKKRMDINERRDEVVAHPDARVLEPDDARPSFQANQPQRMRVWRGCRLQAILREQRFGLNNGQLLVVVSLDDEKLELEDVFGERYAVNFKDAARHLRPAHALTYASVQGLTLPGHVQLDDTDSRHFSPRHLYVGLSRATAAHLAHVR